MSTSAMSHTPTVGIRPDWFSAVVDALQGAAGQLLLVDRTDAPTILDRLAHALPAAHGRAEPLILRGFLVEFAAEHGSVIHRHAHGADRATQCSFQSDVHLACFWRPRTIDPIEGFRKWIRSFFKQLDAVHPLSAANRVAGLIRKKYQHAWNTTLLARRVDTTPKELARSFHREYGVSLKEYQRVIRLVEALDRVHDEKVDAVAL